jgi:hypothetical protein
MKFSPINIQQLLADLSLSGLSDSAIGRAVGAPRATINRLRHGRHKTTSVDRGIKIAIFHQRHFQKKERAAA